MARHIYDEIRDAAVRIASQRKDWIFGTTEVVMALPHLKQSSVRTNIENRCCVSAAGHSAKRPFFRRVGRGQYQIEPPYRDKPKRGARSAAAPAPRRQTVHSFIQQDGRFYVVECMELPIVTQGSSLDDAVVNFREALSLYLEGEDLEAIGIVPEPRVQFIYELLAAS
jgi:predicted RNase H-like HicB family nuclease